MSDPSGPREPTGVTGPVPTASTAQPVAGTVAAAETAKADLGKRFLAFLIDGVIAAIVSRIPALGPILAALYMLFRDGFDIEFMDHRSIGKRILRLRPLRDDGPPVTLGVSAARNWPLIVSWAGLVLVLVPILGWALIPLVWVAGPIIVVVEGVLTITDDGGRRWGDRLAGTRVVETES